MARHSCAFPACLRLAMGGLAGSQEDRNCGQLQRDTVMAWAWKLLERARRLVGIALRLLGARSPYAWREPRKTASGPRGDAGRCVLITGGHGYRNVGDEAQLGTSIARWRELWPSSTIRVFSPDPDYTTKEHGVECEWAPRVLWFDANRSPAYGGSSRAFENEFRRVKRRMVWTARCLRAGIRLQFCTPAESRLLDLIQQADVLHASGGGYLTGMTRSRLWGSMLLLRLCHMLGTPVILTGQTIGVFRDRRDRRLAAWGMASAKYIGLRDPCESEREIAGIGLSGPHVQSGYDDALFCERASQEAVARVLRASCGELGTGSYLAAVFHFWGMDEATRLQATSRFAEMCDFASVKAGLPVVLVPMVPWDEKAARGVREQMSQPAFLVDHGYDYRIARGVFAGARAVLTMKHHPIIFAHGEGVPCLSVALDSYYLRKNRGAMAHFGQEALALDAAGFLGDGLWGVLGRFLEELPQVAEALREARAGAEPRSARVLADAVAFLTG